MASTRPSGTTVQPSRHPVMHQYFEKLLSDDRIGLELEHRVGAPARM